MTALWRHVHALNHSIVGLMLLCGLLTWKKGQILIIHEAAITLLKFIWVAQIYVRYYTVSK